MDTKSSSFFIYQEMKKLLPQIQLSWLKLAKSAQNQ